MSVESSPVETAHSLIDQLVPRVAEVEREGRLPADLAELLGGAGFYRLAVPKRLGGVEATVAEIVETIEVISRVDGSIGWCVMIGATSGLLAGYLPEPFATEVYGSRPDVITGGVFAPGGLAAPTGGGHIVSGHWTFASGCQNCDWLMGGALVEGSDGPRLNEDGSPDHRLFFFPKADVEIETNWDVLGLRGTGSHDLEVLDVFVPEGRAVSLISDAPVEEGPLYMFPLFGLLAMGIAAVSLGIGEAAIEEFADLAESKVATGQRRRLAERASVQVEVARATARLASARAFLIEAIGTAWSVAERGTELTDELRATLRLAATHACEVAGDVATVMYTLGGGTALRSSSPLQRRLRDARTATQHLMVAPPTYELAGRVLLGAETGTSQL